MPIGSNTAKARSPRPRRNGSRNPAVRNPATTIGNFTRVTRTRFPSPHRHPSQCQHVSIDLKMRIDVDGQEEHKRRPRREQQRDEPQIPEARKTLMRWDVKKELGNETAKGNAQRRLCLEALGQPPFLIKPEQYVQRVRPKAIAELPPKDDIDDHKGNLERLKKISEGDQIRGRRRRQVTQTHAVVTRQGPTSLRQAEALDFIKLDREILDLFKNSCALKKEDISKKANFIKTFVEQELIMKIKDLDKRFTFDILRSGSYYEGLKVRKPNEFDIMVCMKANDVNRCFEVQVCPNRRHARHLGGFAYLQYQSHRDRNKVWVDLLADSPTGVGRVLSSGSIVRLFKTLISRCCKTRIRYAKQKLTIEEPTIEGPAVNVKFHLECELIQVDIVLCIEVPEWPSNAKRWGAIPQTWPSSVMVEEIKLKGCHVVPKTIEINSKCWRLSFSQGEKILLNPKAIYEDKKCYRVVKHIYEVNKTSLEPLCSYYLKTLFLHLRSTQFFNRLYKITIIIEFLKTLVSKVTEKRLQHFFIPDVNLFWDLSDSDAQSIISSLNRILLNFRDTFSASAFFKALNFAESQSYI